MLPTISMFFLSWILAKLDSSSRLDDAGAGTVIGTSAFYLVGTEVDGANQSLGLTLTEDPFVNKARNNSIPHRILGS